MSNKTLSFILASCFSFVGLGCDSPDENQDLALETEHVVVIDAVELTAQLAEDPSTRVVVDLQLGAVSYTLDQSEAPMPYEALLWDDGSTPEPVDFLTMSAARGIDLDEPVLTIRPYFSTEGFRQACGTFPEEQGDLYCEQDQWGWVCCSERLPSK